jgi:SAM-dependent methyltransferase
MSGDSYIIRGGDEGRARLSVLSQAMAPYTGALLDRLAWSGRRVLDAGCGGGDVSRELAARVGPEGFVLGIDADGVKIAAATDAADGVGNLAFRHGDAIAPGPEDPFDVIYSRFVLSHLTDPAGALSVFRRRLAPRGFLVLEDVDFDGHFCDPALPAFDRYVSWYRAAAARRGADALIGRALPRLVREAGYELVEAEAVMPAALDGPIKRMAALTLEAVAGAVVGAGIASQNDVDGALADLRRAADDPTIFMSLPRVVRVIARP